MNDNDSKKDAPRRGWLVNRRVVFLGTGVLAVLLVGMLIVLQRAIPGLTVAAGTLPTLTPTERAPLDLAPSIGPSTAPVTIIEYADFGCPTCWYWYKKGTLDQLLAKYGDQIRFIWRDYPVVTLQSPKAAEAGQCANEQGHFWEFHDTVYDHEGKIDGGDLETYATQIGLNMSQFDECLTSHRYRDRVNAEQGEAFNHGYLGAPFFLINDQVLIGPQSLNVFASVIDRVLAGKST
jgi:protein-disulfide isomerase